MEIHSDNKPQFDEWMEASCQTGDEVYKVRFYITLDQMMISSTCWWFLSLCPDRNKTANCIILHHNC